jgi:glycogen operon protein
MWLNGEELPETDTRGHPLHDASFLVLFNAHHDLIDFKLPDPGEGGGWKVEVDTHSDTGDAAPGHETPSGAYPLEGRSLVLLRQTGPGGA